MFSTGDLILLSGTVYMSGGKRGTHSHLKYRNVCNHKKNTKIVVLKVFREKRQKLEDKPIREK